MQFSTKHHCGPDQAVYLYSAEDYAWFSSEMGRELGAGTFGENLTLSDFGGNTLYIGDRLKIGEVVLELTAPRIPCATLAARMGEPGFVKRFKQAERPGVYARVLTQGMLRQGDEVVYTRGDSDVTVMELFHDYYDTTRTPAGLERLLSAPVAVRSRQDLEARLEKALAGPV
ncbi:MOSC domain-containing protein [soil metagenome]